jgi:hypothetical protein
VNLVREGGFFCAISKVVIPFNFAFTCEEEEDIEPTCTGLKFANNGSIHFGNGSRVVDVIPLLKY